MSIRARIFLNETVKPLGLLCLGAGVTNNRRLSFESLERRLCLAAGPIAWFAAENSFDDQAGINDGVPQGNVAFVAGKVGMAFSFDGNDAVNALKRTNLFESGSGDFSYEAWIKFDGTNQSGSRVIAFNYGGLPAQVFYVTGSHQLGFWARDNSGNLAELVGSTALGDDQWHHVAAVRRGATFSIYVDGVSEDSETDPTVGSIITGSSYFRIGGGNSGPGHETAPTANESFFTGLIDELSYYPRALDQAAIQSIVSAGSAGKQLPGPGAWYSGQNGDDLVGINDGVFQGNVQTVSGQVGQAFSFDGQSAVNVAKRTNLFESGSGDFSYEAWIKFDGTNQSGSRVIAFNYGGLPAQVFYVTGSHQLGFWARDNSGNLAELVGSTALGDDQWHHVAAVRRGATFSIYVDGVSEDSETDPTVGSIITGSSYFRIGGGNSGPGHETAPTANESFFTGLIDELKYHARALNAGEVMPINTPPTLDQIGDPPSVNEDAGQQTISLSGISAGGDESQSLEITVTSSNTALIPTPAVNYTPPNATGALSYTPVGNSSGTAVISVTVRDAGWDGTLGNTDDSTTQQTFTVTVISVNDVPSFVKGVNQTVLEDAGTQVVSGWATNIKPGPADESAQTLTFNVSTNNDGLFLVLPMVNPISGDLTYVPAPDANGSATVSVTLSDDGGGSDTSAAQSFDINVTAVNDAPSFVKGADQAVQSDDGAQTVASWATAISAGPAGESAQALTFSLTTNNDGLFAVLPAVNPSSGNLTYTPAATADGSATVTVALSDNGGTANGGADTSAGQTFSIVISASQSPPTSTDDNYSVNENQALNVAAPGVLDNDSDPNGDTLSAVLDTGPSHGTITLNADGSFTYVPDTNFSGADSFTYRANDGALDSAAATVSITVNATSDIVVVTPDPVDPSRTILVINGDDTDETFNIQPGTVAGAVIVTRNDVSLGQFGPTLGRIVAYGGAGNDNIKAQSQLTIPVEFYGGPGNDKLRGGSANDILVGGAGDDLLSGRDGRDLLIGGLGNDKVVGDDDDDILIGGIYLWENQRSAVDAIMTEWSRTDADYNTRVSHLRDGGGTSAFLLNDTTVLDDGVKDTLRGKGGFDWFLSNSNDDKTDKTLEEVLTEIEFDFVNAD